VSTKGLGEATGKKIGDPDSFFIFLWYEKMTGINARRRCYMTTQLRAPAAAAAALLPFWLAACSGGASIPQPAGPSGANPSPLAREAVKIREFNDLPKYYDYYSAAAIAPGPQNTLWVTDYIDQDAGENAIVRIATSGKATATYYYGGLTSEGSSLDSITQGPDGAMWMADGYNGQILRMTTDGTFTSYPVGNFYGPNCITEGPDGALWFTATRGSGESEIGRITTTGSLKTYPAAGEPIGITAGPDGALWYAEYAGDKIGRITTHGKIKEYSNGITAGSGPYSIAAGPHGALWFTEVTGARIGRVTIKGQITEYAGPIAPTERPTGIAAGLDGAMWFTEFEFVDSYRVLASKIGRITADGRITQYSKIDAQAEPTGITLGPDGNVWFVESYTNRTGRISFPNFPTTKKSSSKIMGGSR
jgi:streptogramin lyase